MHTSIHKHSYTLADTLELCRCCFCRTQTMCLTMCVHVSLKRCARMKCAHTSSLIRTSDIMLLIFQKQNITDVVTHRHSAWVWRTNKVSSKMGSEKNLEERGRGVRMPIECKILCRRCVTLNNAPIFGIQLTWNPPKWTSVWSCESSWADWLTVWEFAREFSHVQRKK